MHVLYVHQNFPAQFGHIAAHLIEKLGWQCSFVSETPGGVVGGIRKIQYATAGGATKSNHFCSRTFENTVWHCDAVYHALKPLKDFRPDLIVGHSGFGSTLFLRELYPDVPIINFFEYFYRPHDADSDMDFRKDLGWELDEQKYLRSRCRNAMILLDLNNCQVGYCPTNFQRSRLPSEYDHKLRTIFDGIDRRVYHGHGEALRPAPGQRGVRTLGGVEIPASAKVVTYCSRGFESMRGFDVFMKAAKIICDRDPDVIFLVAGTDRIAYGGDENYTGGKSFKQWVLEKDTYDLNRIKFLGRVDPLELARMLAAADLHMYLTVPFVLSWSMMDAMSAGAVVLGSRTAPVQEMIIDGENGLLADFFSPEEFAEKALAVLRDPAAYRPLGRAAEQMIVEKYSLDVVTPTMLKMYEDAANMTRGLEPRRPPAAPAPRQVMNRSQPTPPPRQPTIGGIQGTPPLGLTGMPRPKVIPPANLKAKPKGGSPFLG
jgi:glycosyltransferase involved in cell wall biosynthesis